MRRSGLRSWHAAALAAVGIAVGVALIGGISTSSAASQAKTVRVAIMTDCKGAFGFGYEPDIGGAEAALARASDLGRDHEVDLLEDPDVLLDPVEG